MNGKEIHFCWGGVEPYDLIGLTEKTQFSSWGSQKKMGRVCTIWTDPSILFALRGRKAARSCNLSTPRSPQHSTNTGSVCLSNRTKFPCLDQKQRPLRPCSQQAPPIDLQSINKRSSPCSSHLVLKQEGENNTFFLTLESSWVLGSSSLEQTLCSRKSDLKEETHPRRAKGRVFLNNVKKRVQAWIVAPAFRRSCYKQRIALPIPVGRDFGSTVGRNCAQFPKFMLFFFSFPLPIVTLSWVALPREFFVSRKAQWLVRLQSLLFCHY